MPYPVRMARPAIFGKPVSGTSPGGACIAVYLVPVHGRRLVVFDVAAREARGRWLPWDVMDFGANPYETAAALADDWCAGAVSSLTLADVLSFPLEGGGWELAIVFRTELIATPPADDARSPFTFAEGEFDAIGRFDPVDLERWVLGGPPQAPAVAGSAGDSPGPRLVF